MSLATPESAGPLRRERLRTARLYFVCDARPGGEDPEALLRAALSGGVDIVQLREKELGRAEIERAASTFRRVCDTYSALFIVNDDPDLARACDADGVHVGQDDASAEEARELLGPDAIVGLSTHSEEQIAAANERPSTTSASADLGDADESRPAGGRPRAGLPRRRAGDPPLLRDRRHRPRPTPSRSCGPGRGGSASCGRSATPPTRARPPRSCAAPSPPPRAPPRAARTRCWTSRLPGGGGSRWLRRRPAARQAERPEGEAPRKRKERGADRMTRGYAKAEERNQAAREALEPLAEGERPRVVTIGAIVAGLIALSIVGGYLAGVQVNGRQPKVARCWPRRCSWG